MQVQKLTDKILPHDDLCTELAVSHDRWAANSSVAKKPPLLVCISSTDFQPYFTSVWISTKT